MSHIYVGDRSKVDDEILEKLKSLNDDFWIFAEFSIKRNVDWFVIRLDPAGGPSSFVLAETKRESREIRGTGINGPWSRRVGENLWAEIDGLNRNDVNPYFQAKNTAEELARYLWNQSPVYLADGGAGKKKDQFDVWPDLLILSPDGVHHRLPKRPETGYGQWWFSADEWIDHLKTWNPKNLPLTRQEVKALAECLSLKLFWSGEAAQTPIKTQHTSELSEILSIVRRLESRLTRLEGQIGELTAGGRATPRPVGTAVGLPSGQPVPPPAAPGQPADPVLPKLGDRWLPEVLHLLATAEERVGGPVSVGALVALVRTALPTMGGPSLTNNEVNRLLKAELVRDGYLRADGAPVFDPATGTRRVVSCYHVNPAHPDVIAAKAKAPAQIPPEVILRPMVPTANQNGPHPVLPPPPQNGVHPALPFPGLNGSHPGTRTPGASSATVAVASPGPAGPGVKGLDPRIDATVRALGTLTTSPPHPEDIILYARWFVRYLRDSDDWRFQLRQSGVPLTAVGQIFTRAIPDLKQNLATAGFEKLLDFVRFCCADTPLCAWRRSPTDLRIVLRNSPPEGGEILSDLERPSSSSASSYRILLSVGPGAIKLPSKDAVRETTVALVDLVPVQAPYDAVVEGISRVLADQVGEPSIKTTIQSLAALKLLDSQPSDLPIAARTLSLRPEYGSAEALLAGLREVARAKIVRILGAVDEDVLREILP